MGFYKLMDFIATCNEVFVVMFIINCFCKCRRHGIFQWIAGALMVAWVYMLTWMTDLGEYKMILIFLFDVIVFWLCYKEKLMKMVIAVMFGLILLILAEPLVFLSAELVSVNTEVMVDGTLMIYWPLYFWVMAVRVALCLLVRHLVKGFVFEPDIADLMSVLLDFILVQIIQAIYYGQFFDGNMGSTSKVMEFLFAVANIGFIVHFLHSKKYYTVKSQKEKDDFIIEQMKMQYAYYQDKQQEEGRIRSIYHDLKNHLLILEQQNGTSGEAQRMLESLKSQISDYENYTRTGNDFLDIIIRDKARAAKENQIDFMAALDFKDGTFIDPLDISSIFGNALDNAIEASMKLPPGRRLVTVKAGRIHDMLSIVVENNITDGSPLQQATNRSNVNISGRTEKSDILLHGFGLPNIQKSVEKYAGQCVLQEENGRFTLKIIIPIP